MSTPEHWEMEETHNKDRERMVGTWKQTGTLTLQVAWGQRQKIIISTFFPLAYDTSSYGDDNSDTHLALAANR